MPNAAAKASPPIPLKAGDVQKVIEQRIFSAQYPPGSKINENALAEELNISRGPVREALNALRHEGLLQIIPNRGAFVASLTVKEALDCYDVRGGLAHTVGKILPFRISMEQIEQLRHLHADMDQALARQNIKAFYRHNESFHGLLFAATENSPLIAMNTAITRKLTLYLRREMSNLGMLKVSNREHLEIIELVADGQPQETAAVFEKHILDGKERLLELHQ